VLSSNRHVSTEFYALSRGLLHVQWAAYLALTRCLRQG
jgi:hypothetical protein